jgi:3-phenylpropionate/trans-cinnamate dioxygenase ferredoxin reductase subunit
MAAAGMVIIGAGECGARAALALREIGYAGPVTLIGAEPHLPYERPPLSKEVMIGESDPVPKTIASAERLAAATITVIAGVAAERIDPDAKTVALAGGRSLPYEKLLIATGSESRHLPLAGPPGGRIAYLRTFEEALHIRAGLRPGAHVAIIGAGFIGLEIAASARTRGATVTVIEALPRVLSRVVPPEIAAVIDARHRHEGVAILCGVGVARIEETEAVAVTLTDEHRLAADFLVIGIGAVPVVAIAEAAGLHVGNGIVVDEHLRTSDPDIYAAGDCCSFPLAIYGNRRVRLECWRNAQDQGAQAARNMTGANEVISALPWFWSDQYDLTLQIAGLPDEGHHTVRRELPNDAFIVFHLAEDGRLVAASGIGHGTAVARDIRLAEMLIGKRSYPEPAQLSAPDVKLKSLLAA